MALSRIYAALKPGANFYLRDIVFVSMPGRRRARRRGNGRIFRSRTTISSATAWSPTCATNISTFGWVIERMLTDDRLHAGLGRLSRAAARHPIFLQQT